jgi:Leucine-rich repeat (LRR) protein
VQLWGNELNGTIPKSLGNCSQLLVLELSRNFLTGGIPQEFGKLDVFYRHLTFMIIAWLVRNPFPYLEHFLTAPICKNSIFVKMILRGLAWKHRPAFSKSALSLDLGENRFTGKIPQEMSNLTGLILLRLHDNLLSGDLPSALGGLSTLQLLDLSGTTWKVIFPINSVN